MRSQGLDRAAQVNMTSTFHTRIVPSTLPFLRQCRCERANSEMWEGIETGLGDVQT